MLAELWEQHRTAPFPPDCRGLRVAGVDLVRLDADVARLVGTYLTEHALSRDECTRLTRDVSDIQRVLPELDGDSRAHFGRLEGMAGILLHHCQA